MESGRQDRLFPMGAASTLHIFMKHDEMKNLIDRLHSIWNSGDLAAVPDVYSPDFVVHWSKSENPPESFGHEGVASAIRNTLAAFPDWHEKVVDLIIDQDRIVTRYVSTGTHLGPLWGLQPTGRRIEIDEISIFRIENGKVAEQWCLVDYPALMHQLGHSPA